MRRLLLALLLLPALAQAEPAKELASYKFDPKSALGSRVQPIPDWLLALWKQADEAPEYRPYSPTAAELAVFNEILAGLPEPLKQALRDRLIAIYFISDFRGNGLTDWVLDKKKRVYSYMILNPAGFKRSMAEVLGARDKSAFKGAPALSFEIGADLPGLAYTLSHESLHVYDYAYNLTPYADNGIALALDLKAPDGWDIWESLIKPRKEHSYTARSRLTFFGFGGGPKFEASEACDIYTQLTRSPFVSLYGSGNWADDAADLFVFTHLTQTLNRPYKILCTPTAGAKPLTFEPLSNPQVKERAKRILAPLYK